MIPHSILDLSPILQGGGAAQAFRNTLDLARHAEQWGYHRYYDHKARLRSFEIAADVFHEIHAPRSEAAAAVA